MGADPRIRPLGVETPAQARALRSAMISCAARFPTCARLFRKAGVDVRALPSADPFAVLRRLPITGADEMKRVSAEAPFADIRIVDTETSSGTTGGAAGGKKTRFITHRDDLAEHRFLARLMSVCGVSARDRVACVDTDPAAAMVSFPKACEILGAAEAYCVGVGARFDAAADALARLRPTVLVSVPSIIERIMDAAPRAIPAAARRVRKVIYIGEPMSAALKSRVETAFGAETFSYYGSSETSALGVECAAHDGVHLFGSRHVFEIETRESAPPDGGRLIATTLHQEGLPLLRYRLGDMVRERPGRCACGLDEPRVDILGRPEEVASVLGSKLHLDAIHDTIRRAGVSGPLRIVLETDGATDAMRLIVPETDARTLDAALTAILREHEDAEFLHDGGILKIRFDPRPPSHFAQDRKPNRMIDRRGIRV